MLVRAGQRFELQAVGCAEEPVEVEGEGVGGELAVEAGGQAVEGVGVVLLDGEEAGELAVDGRDDLAPASLQGREGGREARDVWETVLDDLDRHGLDVSAFR